MARRRSAEIASWEEFRHDDRDFIRARVPRGSNVGQIYTVARRIAERYEVKGFFASGGCGLLLHGRDLNTDTDVLIKTTLRYDFVHHASGGDAEGMKNELKKERRRLETERRLMVILKNAGCNSIPNPNDYVLDANPILQGPYARDSGMSFTFDDVDYVANEPYLIMEQIVGQELTDLIKNPMAETRALTIMKQVAHVLEFAHRRYVVKGSQWSIIYQDLKPDNIYVGDHDYVSLLDWGGCRLYVDDRLMLPGANTPGYCPPECSRVEVMKPAADSYTFGSTLFHMLTGASPAELCSTTGPPSISHHRWDWDLLRRKTSQGMYRLVKECLAENPAERPATGAQLYNEIVAIAG